VSTIFSEENSKTKPKITFHPDPTRMDLLLLLLLAFVVVVVLGFSLWFFKKNLLFTSTNNTHSGFYLGRPVQYKFNKRVIVVSEYIGAREILIFAMFVYECPANCGLLANDERVYLSYLDSSGNLTL